jgi:dTDP-4-amino-4,6-dideoxygalactose transaminase
MKKIPFHVPSLDEHDVPGVLEVLREKWVTTGSKCRAFEEAVAEYLAEGSGETLHCVAVNSGTAALHLALEAMGVSRGDAVLTPSFTFTASAEVARYLGADPLLVDSTEDRFHVSAQGFQKAYADLPKAERARVKAVLPVHYGGAAVEMEELEEFCRAEGLGLVDDAAHALPTRRKGKLIGRFGDVTAFSFYATKTLCTGEGGMAVTRDAELAARMRVMRLHGISHDVFDRYRDAGAWYYEVIAPGFKYNMSDIMAALGLSQLARLDQFQTRRTQIAEQYSQAFSAIDGLTLPPADQGDDRQSWHLYPLRIDAGRSVRDGVIEELTRRGIGTSVHFIPLHLQPYYRDTYRLLPESFPHAQALFERELSLPIYPAMEDGDVERVIRELNASLTTSKGS